jgi:hypothetical protein
MTVHPSALREREARFAARVGTFVGTLLRDQPARVGVASVTIDDALGERSLLRVEIAVPLGPEEALRLRYGDDAIVTRTDRGWSVEFPEEAP